MTHAELVIHAVQWLKQRHRCTVVFAELSCSSPLIPDAIGWQVSHRGYSVLVECKTSRSDFRADLKKPIHSICTDDYPGQERWFFTPPGLVGVHELPKGWLLAESDGKTVKCITPFKARRVPIKHSRAHAEFPFLLSALRRHDLGVNWDTKTCRFEAWKAPR